MIDPANRDPASFQRKIWQALQARLSNPERARLTWIGYGRQDRLGGGAALLSPPLPAGNLLLRDGGHAWPVWRVLAADMLTAAERTSRDGAAP